MINRQYFEQALSVQLAMIGRRVTFKLFLLDGHHYDVWSLVAAHEGYVILEVHSHAPLQERSREWQDANPGAPPWVFDQVVVPYSSISSAYLSTRTPDRDTDMPVGFHHEDEDAS